MEPTAPFHPTGACVSCQLRIVFLVEAAGNGLEMKLIRRNSELGNPKWRQIVFSAATFVRRNSVQKKVTVLWPGHTKV